MPVGHHLRKIHDSPLATNEIKVISFGQITLLLNSCYSINNKGCFHFPVSHFSFSNFPVKADSPKIGRQKQLAFTKMTKIP
jgi:hypothetical protein